MAEAFSKRDVGAAVQPCPLAEAEAEKKAPQPVHWIEIGLVGEDGSPMPWFEYQVTLPDGKQVKGYLDENGMARVENIETAGTARISFTTLDTDAWEAVSEAS